MTMATPKRKTDEMTAPVVAPDEAFGNVIIASRDAAVVTQQTLQNDKLAREAHFDREIARLVAKWDAEKASLDTQIAQQGRILAGCDAALEAIQSGASNVVPLHAAE